MEPTGGTRAVVVQCCFSCVVTRLVILFFFNDPATTEIYTLSLHDALPILKKTDGFCTEDRHRSAPILWAELDRKSTRLNSSHTVISYAVFCLKKKNESPARKFYCISADE